MSDGGGNGQLVCEVCGTDSFTLDGGFYYCDGCGERSKGHRETEIEYQDATFVNIKRSQKKADRPKGLGKGLRQHSRKLRADPHLCERALAQDGDFPAYLDTIGTRLCTATKLIAKIANVLTDEPFRLPKPCVHFSRLILFTYFREASVAFCEAETVNDRQQQNAFCPLVRRTKAEIHRLRREREAKAKERSEQRRRERLERSTIWEQLTRTFAGDDGESDEAEGNATGEVIDNGQEPISLFQRVTTALSTKTVNMAAVLYLGIDVLLCIVFLAVQMVGAHWVQLSDIFRWYREGRFTVSHSQLCALNFATNWELDNGRSNAHAQFCASRLSRRFFVRSIYASPYYGIQSSSESFRVLSFLTQFVGIPKTVQTAPFQDVLFRLVYNLNLPRTFERQLNALLGVLPPPLFTDYGAQRLGAGIPLIDKNALNERLLSVATSMSCGQTVGIGFVSFMRYAFGQTQRESGTIAENIAIVKDRQRHVNWQWLPMASEVNAAALVLFALKLFFGLDGEDTRQQPTTRVTVGDSSHCDNDSPTVFNFDHWLLQLQLRMHCWQGTTVQRVLDQTFSDCQLERSNPEIPYRRPTPGFCLGGSRLFHRNRRQPFAGCVPNVLHNRVQPRFFEQLFTRLHHLPVTPSVLLPISNEELYAPLQFQCVLNRPLLDIVNRNHWNESEQALVEQLDQRNTKIFFTNFYSSTLSAYLPSDNDDEKIKPLQRLFPCSGKYSRFPHPKIHPPRMSAIVAQPLRRMKWVRAIFAASEYTMPIPFRLLLRHLALCVSEWEEVVYMAFLAIQGMFIDLSSGRRRAMLKDGKQTRHRHDFSSSSSSSSSGSSSDDELAARQKRAGNRAEATAEKRVEIGTEETECQLFLLSSSSSSEDESF